MDDETLVQKCLDGDTEAFGELVRRYERLFRFIHRRTNQRELSADLTQQVFLKALLALPGYEPRGLPLRAWLYRIALNESLNRATRRKKSEPLDERLEDRGSSPAESAERSERSILIERAVEQLSDSYREVIVLRHWLDLSYDEIAEALHVPAKTVKSRLFSARTRLGEILATMGVQAS